VRIYRGTIEARDGKVLTISGRKIEVLWDIQEMSDQSFGGVLLGKEIVYQADEFNQTEGYSAVSEKIP
jgi:hypothetical protein